MSTIVGNSKDNFLRGTNGVDVILGLGGQDRLQGLDGDDVLLGGDNIDTVYETGNFNFVLTNTQLTGRGTDKLQSIERAHLVGGYRRNVIDASLFTGGTQLFGLGGNDLLIGGNGVDSLVGGTGNDYYVVNHSLDEVIENEGEGHDTIESSITFFLPDQVEDLVLSGTRDINGTGNILRNNITGNAGDNLLSGGGRDRSVDSLAGLDGDDFYLVDTSISPEDPSPFVFIDKVVETENQGNDTVLVFKALGDNLSHALSYRLTNNVENLHVAESIMSTFFGHGNQLDNELKGNSFDNNLLGNGGSDTFIGGQGNDSLDGGEGIDTADYATSTSGINIDLANGSGNDGMGGTDTLVNIEQVNGSDFNDVIRGDAEENLLEGNSGHDHLYGRAGNDILRGGSGNDMLDGGTGADQMEGGTDNDLYFIDHVGDRAFELEAQGYDTVRTSLNQYVLDDNLERLQLIGDATTGYGNAEHNQILGHVGQIRSDNLFGGAGNDVIHGWGGNDNLQGDEGRDRLFGPNVGQVNPGENEIDVLIGGAGIDTFALGHGANDQVFYAHSGNNDYARIIDFSDDLIQIKGVFEDYDLRPGIGSGPVGVNDTGLYFTRDGANDLVAVVENINNLVRSDFLELG